MNNFFTQLKEKARTIRLSHDEKQSMRVQLHTYFEQNPIGTFDVPAKIPKPMPSMYYFFSPRYLVPAALLLVVGLSGGTAFAAQSALPGNPLYAIKININEKVQTALATTPQAKAEVNAQLATNRLEEAETLAVSGKLDATTTAELAANFSEHAKAAQDNTADVGASDPGTAAQLGAQFNGTLAAHSAILAQIGDDASSSTTVDNAHSLAMEIQNQTGHGKRAGDGGSVLALATDTNAPTPAAAPQLKTMSAVSTDFAASSTASEAVHPVDPAIAASLSAQASTSIAAALQDFAAIKPSLDAATSEQIAAQFAAIQNNYTAGNFALAIRLAVKLDAYIKAGKKFNINLLSGLLTNTNTQDASSSEGGNSNVEIHL